jgi:dihydropyrimidinase
MSPPIRNKEHQRQIKAGLAGGVLSIVATDHAPFNSTHKRAGLHDFRKIPNGVNGIEERLHVAWDELVVPGGTLHPHSPYLPSVEAFLIQHTSSGELSAVQ